jgi:hypothetical protein
MVDISRWLKVMIKPAFLHVSPFGRATGCEVKLRRAARDVVAKPLRYVIICSAYIVDIENAVYTASP